MKILFVYPNIGQPVTVHHGIASLSGKLKEDGHDISLLMINAKPYPHYRKAISDFGPDIFCFSIVSNYWEISCQLAAAIKKDFNKKIFAGGMHCSLFPDSFTMDTAFDGICRGEGEEALSELVVKLENNEPYHYVKNFWFKKNGRILKNDIRPLIQNLDALPFPDHQIFRINGNDVIRRFIFSRGCPYNCSYCSNKAYKDVIKGKGRTIRFRSVSKAMYEIENALHGRNIQTLIFDDDCFNKEKEWFQNFAREYKKRNLPQFRCNTRPELCPENDMRLLKEAGCYQINIGIESGDVDIRKRILKRNISDGQIVRAFNLAKKYELQTFSFNMIGIPGETRQAFKKTIKLNQKIKPDRLQLSVFYPYPGTELAIRAKEQGIIKEDETYNYFYGSHLKLKNFGETEILINKMLFKFNVYRVSSLPKACYHFYLDIRNYLKYIFTKQY